LAVLVIVTVSLLASRRREYDEDQQAWYSALPT